jgi:general secretion pathway protein A
MYTQYWQLNRVPFANDPANEFFYSSETHHAAILKLRYALEQQLGAALLLGATGCGKTCVINRLADELPQRFSPVVRLVFPLLTAEELLNYVAAELEIDTSQAPAESGLDGTIRRIADRLAHNTQEGRHAVIVIDEAHLIEDRRTLTALHLLLNFVQPARMEFSLLMAGDLVLARQVERMPQLDERIGVKGLLKPLSKEDTALYVEHRMAAAGAKQQIFNESALVALFEHSGGVPRRINRLGDLALLVGYADSLQSIGADDIDAVTDEFAGVSAA